MKNMKKKLLLPLLFLLAGCGVSHPIKDSLDKIPPKVVSNAPKSNEENVALNRAINITFSEPLEQQDFQSAFTVSRGAEPNIVSMPGSVTSTGDTITFIPIINWTANTVYSVRFKAGVKDLAGLDLPVDSSWSFKTGTTSDNSGPQVSSVDPSSNSTVISINTTVRSQFSEDILPSSVTASSFYVTGPSGNISGNLAVSGLQIIFTPTAALSFNTNYQATITTAVRDMSGNAMASNFSWSFKTEGQVDTTPPTILSVTPSDASTNVLVNSAVTILFSEAIDQGTVSISLKDGSGTAVNGSISFSGNSAIFTPAANLAYNTAYTVTVAAGVKDLSGNMTTASSSGSFTTAPATTTLKVSALSLGFQHSVALMSDGTLRSWGSNNGGQLGTGTWNTQSGIPSKISGITGVKEISAGGFFTVALKDDGTVWTWGANDEGQLGDGTITNRNVPGAVSGVNGVKAIATGVKYTLVLKTDGTVWAWGQNQVGQLGDGSTLSRYTPVQVSGLTDVVAVAAGEYHSFAVKTDGTVWAWGYNDSGQLGIGEGGNGTIGAYKVLPVQVSGLTNVAAIAGGYRHSIALKADGTIWTWGANSDGAIGDGTYTYNITYNDKNIPTQVPSLSGVKSIGTNRGRHNVILKTDGTVWAWGYNYYGQIGDNTYGLNNRTLSPTQPLLISDAAIVAAGYGHTIIVKNDGTLWACGWNTSYQLGISIGANVATPMQVLPMN